RPALRRLLVVFVCLLIRRPRPSTLFPYTTLFRSIAHGEHGADALAGLQGDQVADVLALTSGSYIRDLVHLQPVNPAGVGEDQDVGVGRSNEQMLNEILVPRLHAGSAGSTPALHAVGGNSGVLEVAGVENRQGTV